MEHTQSFIKMTEPVVRPHAQLNFASVYGLTGLLIAGAVHASTFAPSTLSSDHPLFWVLHIGIFPLFIPMVFRLQKWTASTPGILGIRTSRLRWRALLPYFPRWAAGLGVILFTYASLSFMLAWTHVAAAGHAAAGQAMDPERARYTVRAFSGHWLLFYAMPTLFFLFVPANAEPGESASQAAD